MDKKKVAFACGESTERYIHFRNPFEHEPWNLNLVALMHLEE